MLDRRHGVVEVGAAQVAGVLAEIAARPEPTGAAAVMGAVMRDPASVALRLSAGDRVLHGRLGRQHSVLVTVPDVDDRVRIVPLPTSFVPKAVLRAVGLIGTDADLPAVTWTLATTPLDRPRDAAHLTVESTASWCRVRRRDGFSPASPGAVYREVVRQVAESLEG